MPGASRTTSPFGARRFGRRRPPHLRSSRSRRERAGEYAAAADTHEAVADRDRQAENEARSRASPSVAGGRKAHSELVWRNVRELLTSPLASSAGAAAGYAAAAGAAAVASRTSTASRGTRVRRSSLPSA